MPPEQNVASSEALKVVQDIGVTLMSLGPVPLTVLAGLMVGLFGKALASQFGVQRWHKALIPLIVVAVCGFVFASLTDPSVSAFQPHEMRNPMVRVYIVGAALGLVSIGIHRQFLKDSKLERVFTGEPEDPSGS